MANEAPPGCSQPTAIGGEQSIAGNHRGRISCAESDGIVSLIDSGSSQHSRNLSDFDEEEDADRSGNHTSSERDDQDDADFVVVPEARGEQEAVPVEALGKSDNGFTKSMIERVTARNIAAGVKSFGNSYDNVHVSDQSRLHAGNVYKIINKYFWKPLVVGKPSNPGNTGQGDIHHDGDDAYFPDDDETLCSDASGDSVLSRASEVSTSADRSVTVHRVFCPDASSYATYIGEPVWVNRPRASRYHAYHLVGRTRITDEKRWEKRQRDVPFIVYLEYHCSDHSKNRPDSMSIKNGKTSHATSEGISHRGEEVFIRSPKLEEALRQRLLDYEGLETHQFLVGELRLRAPYLLYHHFKDVFRRNPEHSSGADCHDYDLLEHDSGSDNHEYDLLMHYLDPRVGEAADKAGAMFETGQITPEFIPYLFKPGQLLLHREAREYFSSKQVSEVRSTHESGSTTWSVDCEVIAFDGDFRKLTMPMKIYSHDTNDPVSITDLTAFPLSYAEKSTRDSLLARGRRFWSCRNGRYITRRSGRDGANPDARYMVDERTYTLLNKTSPPPLSSETTHENHFRGSVDDGAFLMRLPSSMQAFDMKKEVWLLVHVDDMEDVPWRIDAFSTLPLDPKSITVLEALLASKIESDKSADDVAGKRSGLVVLLHGRAGTGKTLTAEIVAESVKKPLYRIACDDVGTNPKEVEKYLEAAFQLARTWDCVVLLDEADVFLEQRTSKNLERNALVSMFLRVLEDFDGILLMTTDRVSMFDEALKSRIHLSLRYDSLNKEQREQIWTNFLARLEQLDVDMDYIGIRRKLDVLSSQDMNGRQIRNVITTARPLAKHKKTNVSYDHLIDVIEVSRKFDDYLMEGKVNFTDAGMQREDGIR